MRCLTLVAAALTVLLLASRARSQPSSPAPPGWWCIHIHESADWHWGPSRHPGQTFWNGYYNGFQFTLTTWRRADRLLHTWTDPQWSSPATQIRHAYAIWRSDGGSWKEWPTTSRTCGLR